MNREGDLNLWLTALDVRLAGELPHVVACALLAYVTQHPESFASVASAARREFEARAAADDRETVRMWADRLMEDWEDTTL